MVKSHVRYMDHKHYTDIMHSHGITDPGHNHNMYGPLYDGTATVPSSWSSGVGVQDFGGLGISRAGTGITVNNIAENERWRLSTESRYIGNESVNRQNTESNDTNAIENRPKNYTVKIWKRTA